MLSFARLKDLGIEPEFCLNHGVATSLYYADPDQNLVELQVDIFGNWDASAEWMRKSEDFRQNPVGAFFDPDRVLAAHKAGVRRSSSCKRTRTRGNIPLRNRQTSMSLHAGDFSHARQAFGKIGFRDPVEVDLRPVGEVVRG